MDGRNPIIQIRGRQMSSYIVKKSSLCKSISIPPSKSQTLRAILFGALARGKSVIHRYLPSPDTKAMIRAIRLLGAKVQEEPTHLTIEGISGELSEVQDVIYAGNSGILLRFMTAICALSPLYSAITGDESIREQRPMQALLDGLNQLGAWAVSSRQNSLAPILIRGPLKGGRALIDGKDSQPVSAMLIASAFAKFPIEITVRDPGELPWIQMTLDWFDRLKISYENFHFKKYRLKGNSLYDGFEYTVPGDWSSAAFPIAAALIAQSEIAIRNLDIYDVQGDKKLLSILKEMGAETEMDIKSKTLLVKKGSELKGMEIDINDCIDSITILAVLACFAKGTTRIKNASIAKSKECDRIACISKELKKMGADITALEDGLLIQPSKLKGARVFSYNDHRMAMSLAVAGLASEGETQIESIKCVEKTFPSFAQDFNRLGANIKVIP